ncbi:hypothetical protein CDAR_458261 [Caerostris darwini]|uniref:Ycf15 n=1 Tax=Caerostris darwini TaxID=1538125 RepID=A0AAV4TQL2_9ARAC|nr:hypothetical protein CDAR_458261 [Caerostris darwini]
MGRNYKSCILGHKVGKLYSQADSYECLRRQVWEPFVSVVTGSGSVLEPPIKRSTFPVGGSMDVRWRSTFFSQVEIYGGQSRRRPTIHYGRGFPTEI